MIYFIYKCKNVFFSRHELMFFLFFFFFETKILQDPTTKIVDTVCLSILFLLTILSLRFKFFSSVSIHKISFVEFSILVRVQGFLSWFRLGVAQLVRIAATKCTRLHFSMSRAHFQRVRCATHLDLFLFLMANQMKNRWRSLCCVVHTAMQYSTAPAQHT